MRGQRGATQCGTTGRFIASKRHYGINRYSRGIDPEKAMYGIIGVNIGVFGMWTYSEGNGRNMRWMMRNFTCSKDGVVRGKRFHTLLTSAFSHRDPIHLFVNCFSVYFFAPQMAVVLGTTNFLTLYIGGSIFSSLCHITLQGDLPGLGASGAVYGTIINSIIMFPKNTLLVWGILPIKAWLIGILLIGNDSYELYKNQQWGRGNGNGKGYAAHLGGAAFGAAFYFFTRGRGRIR